MEQEGENRKQHALNRQQTSEWSEPSWEPTLLFLWSLENFLPPPPDERVKQELLTWKLEDPWMVFPRCLSFLKGKTVCS